MPTMPLMPGAEPFHHEGGRTGALLVPRVHRHPAGAAATGRQYLADAGLSVELPRLPGHGTTVAEANLTHWEDWYAEVERHLALLRERCDDVFVMGLSMGGTLSIRLAEEHGDEIAGLVLVNPSLLTKRPDRFLLPVLRLVRPTWPGIASDIKKPGVSRARLRHSIPVKAAYQLSRLWLTTRADLGKVTQPLLVLRSTEDHVVEPDSARMLLDKVVVDRRPRGAARGQLPRGHPRQRRPADLREQSGVRPAADPGGARPGATMSGSPPRRDNGLTAPSYVRLDDVETHLVDELLAGCASAAWRPTARRRSGGAARTATRCRRSGPSDCVYVDAAARERARAVPTRYLREIRDELAWSDIVAGFDRDAPTDARAALAGQRGRRPGRGRRPRAAPRPSRRARRSAFEELRDRRADAPPRTPGARRGPRRPLPAAATSAAAARSTGSGGSPGPAPWAARCCWCSRRWPGCSWRGGSGCSRWSAFVAGFVTLVARMKDRPPTDSGPDDGAVV